MSKLVKKLRQIHEGAAQPLGFRTAVAPLKRQILLMVTLPEFDTKRLAQLAQAEVDAVVIHSPDLEKVPMLQQIASSVGDIPWGVWLGLTTEEGIKRFQEAGGDFLIFQASTTPTALLQEEELGKVMKLDLSQDDGLIRTIDQLPIEAVFLDIRKDRERLNIADLMYCQWLANLLRKPLLVAIQQDITAKEIRALWEVGVNGIVVEVDGEKPQERLAELRRAIEVLPPATKRHRKGGVVLPQVEPETGSVTAEET